MLMTNEDRLVMLSVMGEVSSPGARPRICYDGHVRVTPGTGGIAYNVKAVSYTHLDVYKRQVDNSPSQGSRSYCLYLFR